MTREGFIETRGKVNQQIQYKDGLYAQQHNLIHANGKPQSFRIGKRSWPIPADWQSEPYTLNFQNQGASNVSFRWYPSTGEADMAPGFDKISPTGGKVELSGVAKLEIPAGALSTTQTIRLRQRLQAPQMVNYAIDGTADIQDFITPIVDIEPAGLNLQSPVQLTLSTNMARVGQNNPVVTQLVSPVDTEHWDVVPTEQPNPYLHTSALPITQLGSYAKVMPQWMQSTDKYVPYVPESGFQTQSASNCSSPSKFEFIANSADFSRFGPEKQFDNLSCYGNQVWDYYASLMQQAGTNILPLFPTSKKQIRVYLSNVLEPHTYWHTSFLHYLNGQFDGYSHFQQKMSWSFNGEISDADKETFAHELWYVFQYAFVSNIIEAGSLTLTSQWIFEGPADHMGASTAHKIGGIGKADSFNRHLKINQESYMPVPIDRRNGLVVTAEPYTTAGFLII